MSSIDNCKRNSNTNRKKRKLDVLNDNNNSRTQSSKKRKLSWTLQNIFDREKQLKNEIKILKDERDKYKKIYLQMIDIIQPSQSQTHSNIQNNGNASNASPSINITKQQPQILSNRYHLSNFDDINHINTSNDIQLDNETQLNNNNNKSKSNNKVVSNSIKTSHQNSDNSSDDETGCDLNTHKNQLSVPQLESNDYYCKKCNLYFKNEEALGGHNSTAHTKNHDPGAYYCHKCKGFVFSDELCEHFERMRKQQTYYVK